MEVWTQQLIPFRVLPLKCVRPTITRRHSENHKNVRADQTQKQRPELLGAENKC